jgi:hypothetical protein
MALFPTINQAIVTFMEKRSPRERMLVVGGVAAFLVIGVGPAVVGPAVEAFEEQGREVDELDKTYKITPDILARYGRLMARRKEVESFYDKVDLTSNPLSYLEQLLRDQAKAADGYSVTPRDGAPLGTRYTHKIFSVSFQTVSMEDLARFLKNLTEGDQPMLVTQVQLDKRTAGEVLRVQMEVSAFEPTAANETR